MRATGPASIDAVIVGSGPNGLAAAATLARAGLRVEVFEARESVGGGLRTEALFEPDVVHDVCAAVHPMAVASPFFKEFDLAARGVELLNAEAGYGHPLPDGRAAIAYRDLDATCAALGRDGRAWHRLMSPLLEHSDAVVRLVLHGGRELPRHPGAPLALARGVLLHGTSLARRQFAEEPARALLAGVAAHAMGRLPSPPGAVVALLLGHLAHGPGWSLPRGGSAAIARALVEDIARHGGRVNTDSRVDDLAQLPSSRAVLLDVGPREFLRIAGSGLPARYARALRRFRYGPGAAKVDFLVSEPVPWRDLALNLAGTVHLGGSAREIFRQETATAHGRPGEEPFVLVVDPAATDPSRALPSRRPLWAYAHVPNGDSGDPVERITARIEQFAPGFRDTVLAARGISAREYETYNPNYVGGDIGAGAMTLGQSLFRPAPRLDPYRTPLPGVYLCSASTPPGPGVHGMPGYLAARSVLRREFGAAVPSLAPQQEPG
ncbi:MAG TPA: NAD(P)/FAD-dependent oxidoreductase [Actinospica sp.]|nr:NAD(P)/FAD-dependent oxidoreductase [Actinospica sp.]